MDDFYVRNVFDAPHPFYLMNILKREKNYTLDFHSHDRYHVNIITDGSVTVITKQGDMVVRSGFLFIMPPYTEHKLYSEHGYMQKGADISADKKSCGISSILEEVTGGIPVKIPVRDISLTDCINKKNLQNPSAFAAIKCTNAMTSLIIDIAECADRKTNSFRNTFINIANESAYHFSLSELCKKMSYSKTHLERLVKQEFGCTAIEYMERMRFAAVCNLLVSTDAPLYEIAEKCGFYDSSHLSVFFKKRSGISPIKYRRECR